MFFTWYDIGKVFAIGVFSGTYFGFGIAIMWQMWIASAHHAPEPEPDHDAVAARLLKECDF